MNKELIKQWGENTAYSAKCHYKSADLKRIWVKIFVIVNILFAIFSIMDLGFSDITKAFGIISLIASILILVNESKEDKNTIKRHMLTGDEYLNLHYELQELFYKDSVEESEFNSVSKKMKKMNEKDKPIINQYAKRKAEKAIEKKREMTTWWKS